MKSKIKYIIFTGFFALFFSCGETGPANTVVSVSGIRVTAPKAEIAIDSTVNLVANVFPSSASNKIVTWHSSDTDVATVDTVGLVTGLSGGTVTIIVTSMADTTKSGRVSIIVLTPVTSVSISGDTSTAVNNLVILTAIVLPEMASNKIVVWSSDDQAKATVNASGRVTIGTVPGFVNITARSESNPAVFQTQMIQILQPVQQIEETETSSRKTSVGIGQVLDIANAFMILPSNASNTAVTWTSSDSDLATISETGMLEGVSTGVVTITVTPQDPVFSGSPLEFTFVVTTASVIINSNINNILIGSMGERLTVSGGESVSWESSDATVATVDSTTGLVTPVNAGIAIITATSTEDPSAVDRVEITVVVPVASIVLTSLRTELLFGSTLNLVASVLPLTATQAVQWTISDDTKATVRSDGLVTAKRIAGSVEVIATSTDGSGISDTIALTIKDSRVFGYEIRGTSSDTILIHETGIFAGLDSTDLLSSVVPSGASVANDEDEATAYILVSGGTEFVYTILGTIDLSDENLFLTVQAIFSNSSLLGSGFTVSLLDSNGGILPGTTTPRQNVSDAPNVQLTTQYSLQFLTFRQSKNRPLEGLKTCMPITATINNASSLVVTGNIVMLNLTLSEVAMSFNSIGVVLDTGAIISPKVPRVSVSTLSDTGLTLNISFDKINAGRRYKGFFPESAFQLESGFCSSAFEISFEVPVVPST